MEDKKDYKKDLIKQSGLDSENDTSVDKVREKIQKEKSKTKKFKIITFLLWFMLIFHYISIFSLYRFTPLEHMPADPIWSPFFMVCLPFVFLVLAIISSIALIVRLFTAVRYETNIRLAIIEDLLRGKE